MSLPDLCLPVPHSPLPGIFFELFLFRLVELRTCDGRGTIFLQPWRLEQWICRGLVHCVAQMLFQFSFDFHCSSDLTGTSGSLEKRTRIELSLLFQGHVEPFACHLFPDPRQHLAQNGYIGKLNSVLVCQAEPDMPRHLHQRSWINQQIVDNKQLSWSPETAAVPLILSKTWSAERCPATEAILCHASPPLY